jgi:lipoprotein-anchoring transpeptidase ErfK/SrfK
VLSAPEDRARYIGKIMGGTRVAWQRIVSPDPLPEGEKPRHKRRGEPCPAWVEIRPRGFLCKTMLTPSHDEPGGEHQPVVKKGELVPQDYFKVMADETKVYKTPDDVRAEVVDKMLGTKVMLVGLSVLHIDETPYVRTDHGFIDATALAKFWPSDFAGVDLRQSTGKPFPFAWVFYERGGKKPPVYAEPDVKAAHVRATSRREIVSVLEERDGFVRIADGEWIERKSLRVATRTSPPASVARGAQWIDVDLDEQVLVAYEGETPVFTTLISSGGKKNPTPTATYRVRAKAATTPMAGDPSVPNRYEVSGVPWAVRFADGFFVHGVYWHDGFGGARSHGCVNVAPRDAAFIYDWVGPAVPDGWSEVEVPFGEGAIVRVRDHKTPDPPVFDYSREEPWNVANGSASKGPAEAPAGSQTTDRF